MLAILHNQLKINTFNLIKFKNNSVFRFGFSVQLNEPNTEPTFRFFYKLYRYRTELEKTVGSV